MYHINEYLLFTSYKQNTQYSIKTTCYYFTCFQCVKVPKILSETQWRNRIKMRNKFQGFLITPNKHNLVLTLMANF